MDQQPKHVARGYQKLSVCYLAGIVGGLWVAQGISLYFEEPKLLLFVGVGIIAGGLGYAMRSAYMKGVADGPESVSDSTSE